jgi:hypothetical protein
MWDVGFQTAGLGGMSCLISGVITKTYLGQLHGLTNVPPESRHIQHIGASCERKGRICEIKVANIR